MAKLSHTDSRRMYSWWWDSHISPKNSKWLQENLTDMDVKVKSMIKLLEVDEDSFARRAEMYYKKRPELMRMVEEFYRAYRALAERYDHATAVIRHAHRTMPEAFPNQAPIMFVDESPASSFSGADSVTPDLPTSMGQFTDESNNGTRIMTPKPFKDSFGPFEQVRRGLNFDEAEDEEESVFSNGDSHAIHLKSSKLDQETNSKEITALKEALVTLEAEKESKLQDYQKCLEKISELQTAVSTAQYDAQKLNERANSAEIEAQKLKNELDKLSVEKDAALDQYMQSLEIISSLENKMRLAEEDSSGFKKRAESAESEVESLRQVISELTEEKETAALQYQQCLEIISSLEQKLALANEEAKRLNGEIEDRDSKLQVVEEQRVLLERSNLSLHSELESLTLKMETQSQELAEKQKEHGRLWACVQQERLQFVDGETAFQTLQHVHARTQEELRAMASELQSSARVLKDAETRKQSLQDEVVRVKEENKYLDEMNASSALLIKDMQNQISSLTESKEEFEEEVDKRNALQQEIYCLKEELNDQNGLRTQLAAFGPEIVSLKECISTLENQIDIHIKFQNPKYEELQGSEGSENPSQSILNEDNKVLTPVSELRDLRVRLQAIVKAAVEIKDIMVHENTHLQSKLDESTRRIELLQSDFGLHRRNMRPTSQTTEEDSALLTKDIVLDQISDGSYRYSKKEAAEMDNQIVELWDLSLNKLDISKRSTDSFQEGNKKKVLQRLDSDVQKLTNLQITVQDLKTKLEATEKDKRGKAVIECEALKRQLEEADMAIVKLFHLNGRLTKSIEDKSFSDMKSSFDFEGEGGAKRRRVSEQARRMSEKIGRLQLEVQNLQFVLLKLDDKKEGRSTASETRRRVILRDYLYGVGGRTGQRRRKTQFCACVQPSTLED